MQYILMDYVNEAGWPTTLTRAEQEHWLGAYRPYMETMTKAGVLRSSSGLQPTSAATTVRTVNDKTLVLDGPYADSKEQLGGFHIIEVADLDAAISWATALHGVVEVRPLWVTLGGNPADQGHRRILSLRELTMALEVGSFLLIERTDRGRKNAETGRFQSHVVGWLLCRRQRRHELGQGGS